MAAPSSQGGAGNGLKRKLGPLPVWAWALLGAVVVFWLFSRLRGTTAGSSAQATQQAQTDNVTPAQAMGNTASTDTSGNAQATSDVVTALGGENASLLASIEAVNQDVLGLAQSQISYLTSQTALSSSTSETQPAVTSQPGGSNAPQIFYVSPQALAPSSSSPAPGAAAARSSAASTTGGQPFGGVTSVTKLKNGSTLTTYASGRKVQQVPGKSPYVVKA